MSECDTDAVRRAWEGLTNRAAVGASVAANAVISLANELDATRRERDNLLEELDATRRERDSLLEELDATRRERDSLLEQMLRRRNAQRNGDGNGDGNQQTEPLAEGRHPGDGF